MNPKNADSFRDMSRARRITLFHLYIILQATITVQPSAVCVREKNDYAFLLLSIVALSVMAS